MESIWNKFNVDRAAIIEEAFSIATERGQQEWSNADKGVMSQAANDIVRSLGGDVGLIFVEFEVLVANVGLGVSPGPNADIAQHVLCEGQAPVDSMQLPGGETTCTWKSEYEEVSEEGKYTTSVVETVTCDEFSGGAYSTTSTTSSTFIPSSIPMLEIRGASVIESDDSNHHKVNAWDGVFEGAIL
nr:hypothetical protein FVER53263_21054 [Fusarium verticillioides]